MIRTNEHPEKMSDARLLMWTYRRNLLGQGLSGRLLLMHGECVFLLLNHLEFIILAKLKYLRILHQRFIKT